LEFGKSGKKFLKLSDKYKKQQKNNTPVRKGSGIEKKHILWGFFITVISFTLSISILFASTSIFKVISPNIAALVVLLIIFIGVLFDAIGIAVTAADETPFHSLASKKIRGAKQSIMLLRNASRVSSFCNDVIGDICGVVSGAAGTAIVYRMFSERSNVSLIEVVAGAVIAAVTVGGKAFIKNIGINNANYIVYKAGRMLSVFSILKTRKNNIERKNN
jgi:hypothetical protein